MPEQLKPTEEFYEIIGNYIPDEQLNSIGTKRLEDMFYELGAMYESQLNRLKEKENAT